MRVSRALLPLPLIALSGCGGHVIRSEFAPNYGRFDFSNPPCDLSPQPTLGPNEVGLRYLGAGGLYIEWQGNALLMAPFFSNPSGVQVLFSPLESDPLAVRQGLRGMSLSRVRAIAAGHSHYDHLGDLPLVAGSHVPDVPVWVNRTGANALAPMLPNRAQVLEDQKSWIPLKGPQGNDLPIRFRTVESQHAPHVWGILLAGGEIREKWTEPWEKRHFLSLKSGKTFAFVIDLLSPDLQETRFRIYYQDSANPPDKGLPRMEDGKTFDLAVLCMASHQFVRNHPGAILGAVKPRHVLITHYESFFRDRDRPFRFVPFLTNGSANGFLRRTRDALQGQTAGPEGTVCGPSSPGWTMPMPGEWMRFKVRGEGGQEDHQTNGDASRSNGTALSPPVRSAFPTFQAPAPLGRRPSSRVRAPAPPVLAASPCSRASGERVRRAAGSGSPAAPFQQGVSFDTPVQVCFNAGKLQNRWRTP